MLLRSSTTSSLRFCAATSYTVYSSKQLLSTMSAPIVLPHQEIDQLWFGGLNLQAGQPPSKDALKRWFWKDTIFDTTCNKYEPLVSKIVSLPFDDLMELGRTPNESLALILLLDQLSRNFSRGTPFAFTKCDPLSVKLAEHFVLKLKHDIQHPPYKRVWYYLPFEHSESIAHQELAIAKYAEGCWELREGEWKDFHELLKQFMEFSWRHYIVINKFGRFPGRNKVLGRENTEEETKFMEEGGDTFQ